MNRFARSPPRRIWGKFSNPTPIVEKATPNIDMKSRRGNVVEAPCPVGCDAISKRPRKTATHPTRTMRTPRTSNARSVMLGRVRCMPVVEGRENHLVSVVRLLGNRVPKAFMGPSANRPFRSRSLVRSRIGAFRASDAGSNPAGSMLLFSTLLYDSCRVVTGSIQAYLATFDSGLSEGHAVLRGTLIYEQDRPSYLKKRAADLALYGIGFVAAIGAVTLMIPWLASNPSLPRSYWLLPIIVIMIVFQMI